MPLYEYACRGCGHRFEQRLRYEERLTTQRCPGCGIDDTSLCFSAPSLVAAGSTALPTCASTGNACGCGRASGHSH